MSPESQLDLLQSLASAALPDGYTIADSELYRRLLELERQGWLEILSDVRVDLNFDVKNGPILCIVTPKGHAVLAGHRHDPARSGPLGPSSGTDAAPTGTETGKYQATGVDYSILDASKRDSILLAGRTAPNLGKNSGESIEASRGEPAFVFKLNGQHLALVIECLGTKSSVAHQFLLETSEDHFEAIAYDTVAAAVNDLLCVGALPLVVNAYFATGAPSWFKNDKRFSSLARGWYNACNDASATWGGGETPTLPGIVHPESIDLAASALGAIPAGHEPLLGEALAPGDEIILIASSGIHTNGLSLARSVADTIPGGLTHVLPDGETFGSSLLTPSTIYVQLLRDLYTDDFRVTYISHITGHGLRKLMRANRALTYRITDLLPVPPVLQFIVEQAQLIPSEAYATLNMGNGLAIYCRPGASTEIVSKASQLGLHAIVAGRVEAGPQQVVIEPLNITYDSEHLRLR